MAPPTVTTISPTQGLTRGGQYVKISGGGFLLAAAGTVKVYFDAVESPTVLVYQSGLLACFTPPHDPTDSPVAVRVENHPISGPVEGVDALGAFSFKRPDLTVKTEIAKIISALILRLRRDVVNSVYWSIHPDYVDDSALPEEITKRSVAPNVTLSSIDISRANRFKSEVPKEILDGSLTGFYSEGYFVDLLVGVVGLGRTFTESTSILRALLDSMRANPWLTVERGGGFPDNRYEMSIPFPDMGGGFVRPDKKSAHQWTSAIMIEGIEIVAGDLVGEMNEIDDLDTDVGVEITSL